MNRRKLLKTIAAAGTGLGVMGSSGLAGAAGLLESGFDVQMFGSYFRQESEDDLQRQIKTYLKKVRSFDDHYTDDVFLGSEKLRMLRSVASRLKRLQRVVGHGNFYLLDFDDALKISRRYSRVGKFTPKELDFLEMIFYETAAPYGFFGEKPLKNLTDRIPRREVVKVRGTGNYLYRGEPVRMYKRIRRDVGPNVVLTSGVRSITKQFFLFLQKANATHGNLSQASRSLAPPGYSFHGIGDFDVGQRGFGYQNFTDRFVTTKIFKRLAELGYIRLRYPRDNMLGVRFEPWHIKVVST
ncbi:MAG: D-alanyl-D-alanine carboxypeptidase family protein [Magnetococcales bacterium]|nr:D-alanyl-D-alanine carboxypeptidase family protein [Magnetococcales bacterium]